jgi:hypothetical protein
VLRACLAGFYCRDDTTSQKCSVGHIHTASRCKVFGSKYTIIRSYQANVHCRCPEEHRNGVGMVLKLCGQVVARCFYNIQIILTLTKRQYKSGIRISRISERSPFFFLRAEIEKLPSKKVETLCKYFEAPHHTGRTPTTVVNDDLIRGKTCCWGHT